MDGGIHAREWVAPATVIYYADQVIGASYRHMTFYMCQKGQAIDPALGGMSHLKLSY